MRTYSLFTRPAGAAADGDAVTQPLVAERAEAVGVADAARVRGEDLVLGRRAADGRQTAGRIVDVVSDAL